MTLSDGLEIRVISAPYFLATKLEAFRGRGKGDFLGSTDMADIVSVVDGRVELVPEVLAADVSVREYLAQALGEHRVLEAFTEAVASHMLPDAVSQERVSLVLSRIDQMSILPCHSGETPTGPPKPKSKVFYKVAADAHAERLSQ